MASLKGVHAGQRTSPVNLDYQTLSITIPADKYANDALPITIPHQHGQQSSQHTRSLNENTYLRSPLNTTKSLAASSPNVSGASVRMSQYGLAVVQNAAGAPAPDVPPPSGVPASTDSAKTPCAWSAVQRAPRARTFASCAGDTLSASAKSAPSASAASVAPKSGGVTSDTNHGMSFGLHVRGQRVCGAKGGGEGEGRTGRRLWRRRACR